MNRVRTIQRKIQRGAHLSAASSRCLRQKSDGGAFGLKQAMLGLETVKADITPSHAQPPINQTFLASVVQSVDGVDLDDTPDNTDDTPDVDPDGLGLLLKTISLTQAATSALGKEKMDQKIDQEMEDRELAELVGTLFRRGGVVKETTRGDECDAHVGALLREVETLGRAQKCRVGRVTLSRLVEHTAKRRLTTLLRGLMQALHSDAVQTRFRLSSPFFLPIPLYLAAMTPFSQRGNTKAVTDILANLLSSIAAGVHSVSDISPEIVISVVLSHANRRGYSVEEGKADTGYVLLREFAAIGVRIDANCIAAAMWMCKKMDRALRGVHLMITHRMAPTEFTFAALMKVSRRLACERSAEKVLSTAYHCGLTESETIWTELIGVYRFNPEKAVQSLNKMRAKGIEVTIKSYIAFLRVMATSTTRAGDAAVIHAEAAFKDALSTCSPHPFQLYTELLSVYSASRDYQAVQDLARVVQNLPSAPPSFRKTLAAASRKEWYQQASGA